MTSVSKNVYKDTLPDNFRWYKNTYIDDRRDIMVKDVNQTVLKP